MPNTFEKWFQHFSHLGYGFADSCALARQKVDQVHAQRKRLEEERARDLIDGGYEVGSW